MVKIFLSLFFLFSFAFSDNLELENVVEDKPDLLGQKIESFVSTEVYNKELKFINIIFDPKSSFYQNKRVDVIKVVKTLEDNGLLKLFFDKPKELHLSFKTNGAPLFFVKLMGDSLRNIGYYRYVTTASALSAAEFTWNIALTSEYATDPIVLESELNKSGCYITNIERLSATEWVYTINTSDAYLNLPVLQESHKIKLKHSLYAHWLNCSNIDYLKIKSSRRNNWYPAISYYDASLHLIKVLKRDTKSTNITLRIPEHATYIKISDLYTLKNVKDELVLYPSGRR